MDSINLTSLTDVLLTLLVLFMVLESYNAAGFVVQLPGTVSGVAPLDPTVYVTIDSRGGLSLKPGKGPVENLAIGGFQGRMSVLRRKKQFDRVVIKAAGGLEYRQVVPVLDRARGAGFEQILLDWERGGPDGKSR